jgi:hypothetical protein
MFIVMAIVLKMKMTIVKVVGMAFMLNSLVSTTVAVHMRMRGMELMFGHGFSPLGSDESL